MFCVVISILVVFVICLGECLHTPSVPSVWKVFSDLADKTQACNLGHGFPDWECPPFVLKSLKDATNHQYTRPAGYPPLTEMLAQRYSEHLETRVDPNENVAITVGASQALYLALRSILSSSDEIILFDPFFELYTKQIRLTGAKPVFVPLGSSILNPWALDIEALRRYVSNLLTINNRSIILHMAFSDQ